MQPSIPKIASPQYQSGRRLTSNSVAVSAFVSILRLSILQLIHHSISMPYFGEMVRITSLTIIEKYL